jgi:hypothetical protein
MQRELTELEKSTLQTQYYSSKWYLLHHNPQTVAVLSLAAVPNEHPVSAITVSGSIPANAAEPNTL